MKSAWSWFLAKMMVLPRRSPSAIFSPCRITCSRTLSTVSSLNSHRFSASGSMVPGTVPSSSHSNRVPAFFLFVTEIFVANTFALKLHRYRNRIAAAQGIHPSPLLPVHKHPWELRLPNRTTRKYCDQLHLSG